MGKQVINIGFEEMKKKEIKRVNKGRIVFKNNAYGLHTFRDNEKKIDPYEFEREIDPYNMQTEIINAYNDKTYNDGGVFHSKTKNNMYWVNGEWKIEKEAGKFNHETIYNKHLQMYEDRFSKQQTGYTLKEIKLKTKEKLSQLTFGKLETEKINKELNEVWSLYEANILLEKRGIERIISSKKGYSKDREISFADEMKKKKFTTTYVLGVSADLMIENDYYTPIYDSKKHSNGKPLPDPHTKKEIDFWGVEKIDYDKFKELGDTYIDFLIDWKKEKHGELPDGRDHIISAVWHFDEKTPHLHIEASNISFKEYKRNKKKDKRMSVAYKDEFFGTEGQFKESIKVFRNQLWERLKDRHFPNLEREVPTHNDREVLTIGEYKKKWNEMYGGLPILNKKDVNSYFENKEAEMINKIKGNSFERRQLCIEIIETIESGRWGVDKEIGFRERWLNLGMPIESFNDLVSHTKEKQKFNSKTRK